jgi:hypothetical protein
MSVTKGAVWMDYKTAVILILDTLRPSKIQSLRIGQSAINRYIQSPCRLAHHIVALVSRSHFSLKVIFLLFC